MEKNLYLPVETKNREFDAKLLLACAAAEAGYSVVLGYKKRLLKALEELPPGIFLDKSMPLDKIQKFLHLKNIGHKLMAHDEEGLAPFSLDEYQRRRQYCNEILEHCEYMLAWGPWQGDFIRGKAPLYAKKVVETGHPRVDLTRRELRDFHKDDVEQISREYGRFILLNSNFSFGNHFFGKGGFVELLERSGKIRDEQHHAFYVGLQHHQERLFEEFTASVKMLHERFPDMTILVRPHPSENHEHWREVLPQHDNIVVKHEGNVLPWLMAADVVIHSSCTTGVEAYLLERPVIAYLPVRNEAFEGELSNKLADWALNREELLQLVERYVSEGASVKADAARQALAAQHIAALDGELAADRIVKLLQTIPLSQRSLVETAYQHMHRLKRLRGRISLGKLLGQGLPGVGDEAADKHKRQKFPGVELNEIHDSLQKFQTLLQRFSGIQVTQIDKNLFQLQS